MVSTTTLHPSSLLRLTSYSRNEDVSAEIEGERKGGRESCIFTVATEEQRVPAVQCGAALCY
jgi:hypothetical protein